MRKLLGVDEALDGRVQREAGRDEDRADDEETCDLLRRERAQEEGDPDRNRRGRVTEVVDEIGEKGNRVGGDEDRRLHERSEPENAEAQRDRAKTGTRAHDRAVDEAVRVTVVVRMRVVVIVATVVCHRSSPASPKRRISTRPPSPAWSTWSVVCSIPNSSWSSVSSSRRRPWQSSPGRTRTCADSAGKPDVIVHTWRSCTSTTPGAEASRWPSSAASIPRGVDSRRIAVESRRIVHVLARTSSPMKILTSASASTHPVAR